MNLSRDFPRQVKSKVLTSYSFALQKTPNRNAGFIADVFLFSFSGDSLNSFLKVLTRRRGMG